MAKLVTIGDSLTQGFQSLAISRTDLAFPSMIAERLGLNVDSFSIPDFKGAGGLPFNIEWLARKLQESLGDDIRGFEWFTSIHKIVELLDHVEDYWERGKGSQPSADTHFHNLAVWGFEVGDSYNITPALCKLRIGRAKDQWFNPPSEPRLRTATRVLNPGNIPHRDLDTQLSIAKRIKDRDGRIEHLILALGANNCLGTVVDLEIRESGDNPPGPNSGLTLWQPEAFRQEFRQFEDKASEIGADHIYIGTVPHVTIPPITRGVMKNRGRLPESRKYFDYYTRFWIRDKDFDPDSDPSLKREEAEKIDRYIDEYNAVIRITAANNGWHLVDVCRLLDDLAVRRNHGKPKRELPAPIADLSVRFFEIEPNGAIRSGGLIGLDGVHPTTCGYALIAQEFIDAIKTFEPTIRNIDFAEIRKWDTLVSSPPLTLNDIFGMLQTLEKRFHMSRWMA